MALANQLATVLSNDASVAMGGADLPTPASILGAAYHTDLDLSYPGVAVSGGVVSSVPNKARDGGACVVGPGTGATWEAAGFLGGPSMLFNAAGGSAQAMTATFNTPIPTGSRVFIWAAMQCPSLSGNAFGTGIAFDLKSADGARALIHYVYNSGGFAVLAAINASPYVTGAPLAAFDTSPHYHELGNTTGGVDAYGRDNARGNISAGGSTVTDAPLTALLLCGYGATADQRGHVRIARIIVANSEPTAAQRAAMKGYFKRIYPGLGLS